MIHLQLSSSRTISNGNVFPHIGLRLINNKVICRNRIGIVDKERAVDIVFFQSITCVDGITLIMFFRKNCEEIAINSDVAMSGMSVVKVPIVLETFRALEDEPSVENNKLISETLVVQSGNFSANLLLDVVAGEDDAFLGADIVTDSMRRLGLENTFIAVPYEEQPRPGRATYETIANSSEDSPTDPDPAMQTTAEDIGTLLGMIYYCAQDGGGGLLAAYGDQIEQEECQQIIDFMALNRIGSLIEEGVPADTKVAHKHGWISDTHGDAGIVFSPGGDYVIVTFMYKPDWLEWEISSPLLADISLATYNYFNFDDPYLVGPRAN